MAAKRPLRDTAALFERHSLEQQLFTWRELRQNYDLFLNRYPLHRVHRFASVLAHLVETGVIQELTVEPENKSSRGEHAPYKSFSRLSRQTATATDVALSLRLGSYLSHGTAAELHGLLISDAIYVNKEQSAKPPRDSALTQEGIDLAFSNAPRTSQYIYRFKGERIVLVSGKNTSNFEVIEKRETSRLTTYTALERTLFDIAVRPTYAGGITSVLSAYSKARDRIDMEKLLRVIKRVDHLYPYHQAIGFYLSRVGMTESELRALQNIGLEFNFYLGHKMKKPKFDRQWHVFFPSDL